MFRSATQRLTLGYLALIMGISVIFSVVLYRISSQGIQTGLQRQRGIILSLPRFDGLRNPGYLDSLVDEQIAKETQHLLLNLSLANLAVLVIGGGAAYILARQTLSPIERALEAQTRFATDASHELRTPLTAMKSEIEVALRDQKLVATEARQVLASNLEEIDKLDSLAAGLLKLAQRQGEPEFEPVQVLAAVDAAAERLAKAASLRGIRIDIAVGKDLVIEASRPNLVELVVILLDNALKYSPDHERVSVKASSDGSKLRLEVADHGVGIKASDVPHIFDRFYRADRSRTKQHIHGYGLGLAIAREIVKQHHGQIQAQSHPGEGTTMIVRLPLMRQMGLLSAVRRLV